VSSRNDKVIISDSEASVNMLSKLPSQRKVHKIMIIGDSHARGCSERVKNLLSNKFEVNGLVKPGTGTDVLTNSAKNEVRKLTKRDVIVFWGGANDVSKNNSKIGLRHIINFVKDNSHTNIILLSVPHRYDLIKSSCVNNEISMFNRKLAECVKIFSHSTILDIDIDREGFTRQGMHLNQIGKERVATIIGQRLTDLLARQVSDSTALPWTDDGGDSDSLKEVEEDNLDNCNKGNNIMNMNNKAKAIPCIMNEIVRSKGSRLSTRSKKVPILRNKDFLWEIYNKVYNLHFIFTVHLFIIDYLYQQMH
jgi:hypothetical protein